MRNRCRRVILRSRYIDLRVGSDLEEGFPFKISPPPSEIHRNGQETIRMRRLSHPRVVILPVSEGALPARRRLFSGFDKLPTPMNPNHLFLR